METAERALQRYDIREVDLPADRIWPKAHHLLSDDEVMALRVAEATGRPLLIQGEPGTGKSQLARVAAAVGNRQLMWLTVDSRTESSDLLWRFDAVARLGDAYARRADETPPPLAAYIVPGVLWWAYNWESAKDQLGKLAASVTTGEAVAAPTESPPEHGVVLLLDEIDKAESDVPNGLLESLGSQGFRVPKLNLTVTKSNQLRPPLVILTSNGERELPAAFLRRCIVLTQSLPTTDTAFVKWMTDRARLHYSKLSTVDAEGNELADSPLAQAAQMLWRDRQDADSHATYRPGLSEYLDLLTVISHRDASPQESIAALHRFMYRKQV